MKKQIDAGLVKFTFDGGLEPLSFDPMTASQANRDYAVPFGFAHRLGDCAAQYKTDSERRTAIVELMEHYTSGSIEWNTKAGPRAAPQDATILKLSTVLGLSYDATMARVAAAAMAELAAVPAAAAA